MSKQCQRVVVINDFSISNGGASAIAFENAIQLAALNIPVTFISADGRENPLQGTPNINCLTIDGQALNPDKPIQGMVIGLHNRKAQQYIAQWVRDNDTPNTIYHVHCWSKIFSPSLFIALKPVADRLAIHGHDYFPACPNGAFIYYPTNADCKLTPGTMACLKSNCDQRSYTHKLWRFGRAFLREQWIDFSETKARLILLHESMREYFLRADFKQHNLELIANPVRPYAEARIPAEENKTFIYIGRVVPEKGVDTFLAAVAQSNLPAKVIGDGESLIKLKAAYPNVEFTGWQDQTKIIAHLKTARAVVMPSKLRETFGLVSVEAVASGLPVVVSDKSPLAPAIDALKMGSMFDPMDVDDLVSKMQAMENDNDKVAMMSHNGVNHWEELAYKPAAWGRALLALYNTMLNG